MPVTCVASCASCRSTHAPRSRRRSPSRCSMACATSTGSSASSCARSPATSSSYPAPRRTTPMTDEIDQLLKNLRLRRMAQIFDDEQAHAEKHQLSYGEFTARLLRAEWHQRQEGALAWRIKNAGIPEQWTLESFPFRRQPGVSQKQIRAFAELDFVTKAENIVLVGPTGVGKTGLASGLLLKALQNGHRGLFLRAQDLFDDMYASLADALLSRLRHRCHTVRIDGPSLRDPQG